MDQDTRKWLPLLLNALAECPVRRGEVLVPHEDVISETEQLTVLFNNDMGFGRSGNFSVGQFGNYVHVETRVSMCSCLIIIIIKLFIYR